jgi:GT2 family glycosyltransferase
MFDSKFHSLSVIIPNYNGEQLLPFFLPFLYKALRNYGGEYEVIIVDDKSTDLSSEVLLRIEKEYPFTRCIFNQFNLGFSGTCNVGIKAAKNQILFFFNNDVEINEDYFQFFTEHFDDPDLFAVTCAGFSFDTREPVDGLKRAYWKRGLPRIAYDVFEDQLKSRTFAKPYYSFAVQGAYFFADKKKVDILEGFDELFSPYNYEETDLSYRALKRGWKIIFEPRCIGYHKVNTSINKLSSSSQKRMIFNRNRLLFVWKNIHYKPYLLSNILYVIFKLLIIDKGYWWGVRYYFTHKKEIINKRNKEKREFVIDDLKLFYSFKEYQKNFK